MRSATPVYLPSLTDVFANRYLHILSPAPLYQPLQHPAEISLDGTSTTAASTLTGGTGSGDTSQTPPENPKSLVIRNLKYEEKIFGIFVAKGLLSKKLKESWKARNVYPPKNSKGKGVCVPFHVLGYCNLRCGLAEDHAPPLGRRRPTTMDHPAKHLVQVLGKTRSPVVLSTKLWTTSIRDRAVSRGAHKSATEHIDFLRDELADMVDRVTWMVLPYHQLRELQHF
jgi:hypothetical protein